MFYNTKEKIFWFALLSRLITINLSCVSNLLLPDHEPNVFKTPKITESSSYLDYLIHNALVGLTRWDAQYFLHISWHGYTYENTIAFFPSYPCMIKVFSYILYLFVNRFINYYSTLLLTAFIINVVFFVKSATVLYKLSLIIFKSKTIAYKAAIFFCVNPGNIFFTAFYSESCYTFFTFFGMLLLLNKKAWPAASMSFGLSCLTRSNGVLNLGFVMHMFLKRCLFFRNKIAVFTLFLMSLMSITPFIIFQLFCYSKYCLGGKELYLDPVKDYGQLKGYVFPGEILPPWCNKTLPVPYSYVQDHYWNVGFLRYFEWKQLPNFLLASPIIIFVFLKSVSVINENRVQAMTLGFNKISKMKCNNYIADSVMFVYIVHILCLTLFCTFCIHVQVTTRMLASSSPMLYWYLALYYNSTKSEGKPHDILSKKFVNINDKSEEKDLVECVENVQSFWKVFLFTEKACGLESCLLKAYIVIYFVLGTVLFSNNYPWT